jgi:hypothetical protein
MQRPIGASSAETACQTPGAGGRVGVCRSGRPPGLCPPRLAPPPPRQTGRGRRPTRPQDGRPGVVPLLAHSPSGHDPRAPCLTKLRDRLPDRTPRGLQRLELRDQRPPPADRGPGFAGGGLQRRGLQTGVHPGGGRFRLRVALLPQSASVGTRLARGCRAGRPIGPRTPRPWAGSGRRTAAGGPGHSSSARP